MPATLKCLSLLAAIAAVAPLTNGFAQALPQTPIDRIRGPIAESDVVTLAGNVHPLARVEDDRGNVDLGTRMERLVLVLRPSEAQQRELDALTEAQQEPGSPLYHRWLTPAEFGSRFGVSEADRVRISRWLAGHGFAVEPVAAGRSAIVFSGSAGQVEETFHASLHRYVSAGVSHIANYEDPQIPKALSPVIAGVLSLHDFRRMAEIRSVRAVADPENTQGSSHYLFPADFATIYDLNSLYAAGKNGAGVSIAIVGRSAISLDDVRTFRSYAGLSTATMPSITYDGANPGKIAGDQDEATLDVEWAGGVAPGASVKYVAAGSTATTDGVDLAAHYIVNNKVAPLMSVSFGSCEAEMGTAELAFYNQLWQQAASEGISSFVSSGDSGAAGCETGKSAKGSKSAVNGMCSSQYVTCVGGTEFNEGNNPATYWNGANGAGNGSARGYIPERVWNESASAGGSGLWASGGGTSGVYSQPGWQKGVSGASGNGMRAVPDVALSASLHDGYLVCLNGNWYVFGGTSASSPSFAGIMALVVQKLSGAGQGNANPILYGLLGASANPFHATPGGNNSVPGVNGYTASGAAYNLATGLGSVDGAVLAKAWPSADAPVKGFSLTPSVASISVAPGKKSSFTVAVGATGGFNDSVTIKAAGLAGVSFSVSPASARPGTSVTVTVSVGASVAAGVSKIVLTGTSAGLTATASVALTVLPPPTLTLKTAAAAVVVKRGKSTTLLVTVATGGSFSGTVALSVSGLPGGVSASWSASSWHSAGVEKANSTLTLKATGDAALSTANVKIVATGEGLQAQSAVSVKVTKAS